MRSNTIGLSVDELAHKYYQVSRTLGCIVDSIPTPIWAKDSEGVYQMANKAFADALGMRWQDIIGKTDYDLFPAEQADKFRADDEVVINSCGVIEVEETVKDVRYGDRLWRTVKNSVCSVDNIGLLVVGISEDITEHVRRRESAKNAIRELESFIQRQKK